MPLLAEHVRQRVLFDLSACGRERARRRWLVYSTDMRVFLCSYPSTEQSLKEILAVLCVHQSTVLSELVRVDDMDQFVSLEKSGWVRALVLQRKATPSSEQTLQSNSTACERRRRMKSIVLQKTRTWHQGKLRVRGDSDESSDSRDSTACAAVVKAVTVLTVLQW